MRHYYPVPYKVKAQQKSVYRFSVGYSLASGEIWVRLYGLLFNQRIKELFRRNI